MSKLKPCPFCGGDAEIVDIDEGENAGGSCVCCIRCQASSNVEFEFKENFVSNWNARVRKSSASGDLNTELGVIADKARDWAENYDQGSDGRNTFILFAEWVEKRISPYPDPPHDVATIEACAKEAAKCGECNAAERIRALSAGR